MFITDVDVAALVEKHPELQIIRDITANHGEKSEISELCQIIAHLYAKVDALTPTTTANVKTAREK